MLVGSVGGLLSDMFLNPNSDAESQWHSFLVGGVGGLAGGLGGGLSAAWVGTASLAAMMTAAAVEGGIDGGVQSALNGDSWGWVLARNAGHFRRDKRSRRRRHREDTQDVEGRGR